MADEDLAHPTGVAGENVADQELDREPGEPSCTTKDNDEVVPGNLEPWPEEKPGLSPEEEEMILKVTICRQRSSAFSQQFNYSL